jgi:hypothetical protein
MIARGIKFLLYESQALEKAGLPGRGFEQITERSGIPHVWEKSFKLRLGGKDTARLLYPK